MRDIFTVVKFTMKDMVKRKSFIISTLIILTFIVVGFNVPNLIKSFNGDNSGNKLLIIDSKNVFEGTLENLKQMDLGYEFEITNEDLKFEDVKKKIENEEIKEAIIINQENEKIKVLYIVENKTTMNEVPEGCMNALTSLYSNLRSTSPKTIVLGKTIGIGLVGLAQMILIVATALISAKTFLEPGVLDSVLDMSNVTPYLGIMTAIYFILGYLAYALLYALTGSTVSKPEDIQSANSPVAILAVIGFYLSYFTMMNPTSKLNLFASLFPISSPFCMPFRIMMGLANSTDVIMSIVILVITIIVIANVAIKIYSNAILNYGTKMSIKDIIKMYKEKQS